MHSGEHTGWHESNQRHLTAALEHVRRALERHAGNAQDEAPGEDPEAVSASMSSPPALETLCALFGLSPFERDVLLLCAGMELDARFAALCAAAQGDERRPYPTFSLALAALPEPHWSALSPGAPLRRWQLIEVGAGDALVASPLRVDERVLHYLAGLQHLDEHLAGFVRRLADEGVADRVPSYRRLAERVAANWSRAAGSGPLPAVQLCGGDIATCYVVAAAVATRLGLNLYVIGADALPATPHDLETFIRLWQREAALSQSMLLLDCDALDSADAAREALVGRFIEETGGALLVAGRERRRARHRALLTFDIDRPTSVEQRALWQEALGEAASAMDGEVDRLVSQFDLSPPAIRAACVHALDGPALATDGTRSPPPDPRLLWDACRVQSRPRLDDLAQRIQPAAGWDDLVLPERQKRTLRDIAVHVRQRAKVYEDWGFAAKSARGLGISALFAGPSGTGKTMAAEVLAAELRLDLYRIDLSQVVSKYIGETEKNLRQVFDAAEAGGSILLFDEADALFGKRSEVKDSHDRYANIEVSYLLQRMESYRGLAILTTNMKQALDDAFLRRIRFVVAFPFPDPGQRMEIWRRIFPPGTPTQGLDWDKLARLNVAGGNIRNIALYAAFLAADQDGPVRMSHLLAAARAECAKLEKPLTDAEIKEWI